MNNYCGSFIVKNINRGRDALVGSWERPMPDVHSPGTDQSVTEALNVVRCHEQHASLLRRYAVDGVEQARE
jgi:hypothetical protein